MGMLLAAAAMQLLSMLPLPPLARLAALHIDLATPSRSFTQLPQGNAHKVTGGMQYKSQRAGWGAGTEESRHERTK